MIYKSPKMRRLDRELRDQGGLRAVVERLYDEGNSQAEIGLRLSISARLVAYYMRRFREEAQEEQNAVPQA